MGVKAKRAEVTGHLLETRETIPAHPYPGRGPHG